MQSFATNRATIAACHWIQQFVPGHPGDGPGLGLQQSEFAQVPSDFGNTAGQKQTHRRMTDRTIGQTVDEPRHERVDFAERGGVWPLQTRCGGDRRDVQQQIGAAADGRVNQHRVEDRIVGQDLAHRFTALDHQPRCGGRITSQLRPDRLTAGCQRRMRHGHAECFGDDLAGRRGAQELATAAGSAASAAAFQRRFLQRHFAAAVSGADRLHFAGIFANGRRQRDAAGNQHIGQDRHSRPSAIIIAGKPLSQVAIPITPLRRGSDRISRRITIAASLR